MKINNIFCVGRNYKKHAKELGNPVPKRPMIFTKPTNSVLVARGQEIHYPSLDGEIHYEIEVVLKIKETPNTKEFKLEDIISHIALGIDLTKRDLQTELKEKGHPWLLAKGFKNATVLTDFWEFPGEIICQKTDFTLMKNKITVQRGNISHLIFPFKTLIRYINKHFGLRKGDIIFTGTPEGVGPIADGDWFEMFWGEEKKGSFGVRMN